MKKLLQLLEEDCTLTRDQLAAMSGMTVDEVNAAVARYEEEKTILGYKAIVDWDSTDEEMVTAIIKVNLTPQRTVGFDRIAERLYQYDEVETVYLMSGDFELLVVIAGRTLKEVGQFVSERLSTIEGVTNTTTHFILKKYKEKNLVFKRQEPGEREFIFV